MRASIAHSLIGLVILAGISSASPAEASDRPTSLFLSRTRVVWDAPGAPPLTLVGRPERPAEFSYASFAVELFAYLAKELLPDSPDEFYGNSNLPSTWNDSMPETPHDFGGHCLEVVQDIGDAIMPEDSPKLPAVGGTRPMLASALAQGVGAALAVHEVWKAVDDGFERDRRSDVFSIDPKVGSNKIALALTLRW